MNYFYILKCKDGTLYSGTTKNIKERAKKHNTGKGSKYVWAHGGGTIIYSEKYKTLSQALKREAQVKNWPRIKKLALLTSR